MGSEHINFHSLSTEPRKRHTRSFRDPRLGDREFTLTLETPDALTDYHAADVAGMLVRRYVTGDEALGMPAQPFMVGEEVKALTPRLCDDAALVVAMQPQPPEYGPEEVLQMAFKVRSIWLQVRSWALRLSLEAEIALPNDSAGREDASSGPRSNADTFIPELSATSA